MDINGRARESSKGQGAPTHQWKEAHLKEDASFHLTERHVCEAADIQYLCEGGNVSSLVNSFSYTIC